MLIAILESITNVVNPDSYSIHRPMRPAPNDLNNQCIHIGPGYLNYPIAQNGGGENFGESIVSELGKENVGEFKL